MTRAYGSPGAFKDALESQLKQGGVLGIALQRRRQQLVFQRFLARIVQTFGSHIVIKGGLALELRLDRARTTRDIDIALFAEPLELLGKLQASGQLDLGDFMTFEVQEHRDHPELASEHGLVWRDLVEVLDAVQQFLDPVLDGPDRGRWDRSSWCWLDAGSPPG